MPIQNTYFLTIRKHNVLQHVAHDDILMVLSILMEEGLYPLTEACEIDGTYKQLHYHGVVVIPPRWKWRPFTQLNGFRLYWNRITTNSDYLKIARYIHKNEYECHKIINEMPYAF